MKAAHFVLRFVSYGDAVRHILNPAARLGYDTIIIQLADGLDYGYPALPCPGAWTKDRMQAFINKAALRGIKVVPEVQLLTHQEKFLKGSQPSLMLDDRTYDPYGDVYGIVRQYIDDIMGVFGGDRFHIGHDEVNNWQDESLMPIDGSAFVRDITMIRSHVIRNHPNVRLMMWGDMLASPDEFPSMSDHHFHGLYNGFGAELRSKIPKDIIICDWRYFGGETEFPIAAKLVDEGFDVIGATWKGDGPIENYPTYLASNGGKGMIATTWWHVQKQQWDVVSDILTRSANSFNRYF